MPKLTGPLQSLYARGTLGHELTYRRSARGTTVTRKPRHPVTIPKALAANAAVVTYLHYFIQFWGLHTIPEWANYAKRLGITETAAILKRNLNLWKESTSFTYDPQYTPADDTPPAPTILASIRPGSSTPIIEQQDPYDYFYLSVHRSADPDEPANPQNVIRIVDALETVAKVEDRHDLHGNVYYRAIAWYIEAQHTPTAEAVSVTLP
jgi:hypothetical protein